MSIIAKIPDDSRARYPVALFESAPLDGFGQYRWDAVTSVLMTALSPSSIYVIERIAFYQNGAEADWLSSMLTPADFPRITLQLQKNPGANIYGDPFRCVNFVDNNEQLIYFRSPQKDDQLIATMQGAVQQVPGMVGELTLRAQVNFTVYEIVNQPWIKTYGRNPAHLGDTVRV